MNVHEKNIDFHRRTINLYLEEFISSNNRFYVSKEDDSVSYYEKNYIEEHRDYKKHELLVSINELSLCIKRYEEKLKETKAKKEKNNLKKDKVK